MIEFGQVPNENAQESLEALFRFQSDKKATNLSIHTKLFCAISSNIFGNQVQNRKFLLEIVQKFSNYRVLIIACPYPKA